MSDATPRRPRQTGRALGALALIVALAFLPAVFALIVLDREAGRQAELLDEALLIVARLQRLHVLSERRARYGRDLLTMGEPDEVAALAEARAAFADGMRDVAADTSDPQSRQLLEEVAWRHARIEKAVDALYIARLEGAPMEELAARFELEVEPVRAGIDAALIALEARVRGQLKATGKRVERRRQVTLLGLGLGVGGAALLSAATGMLLFRLLKDLSSSEERFRGTFEQAAVGMAHVGLDGRWLRVNERACELLGYSREELLGLRCADVTHPDDLDTDVENTRRLLSGEIETYAMDKRYLRRSGAPLWATLTVSLARDHEGAPAYFISVFEDIDEKKRIEVERERLVRALKAAVQTREDFLAVASHELKTPLTPLVLQLESLLVALERVPHQRRLVAKARAARSQVRRLERLVGRLLEATELAGGALVLRRERTDAAALVRDVAQAFVGEAAQARVELRVHAVGPLWADMDPARVRDLLSGLLSNAIRYGAGAPVDLRTSVRGRTLLIEVEDRGPGLAEEAQARIFERFERAASAQHYGGLGLGLFLARRIVEAHGGGISVESAPGRGATFRVQLPCEAEANRPRGA